MKGREKVVIDFLKLYAKMHRAGLGPTTRQIADGIANENAILLGTGTVYDILKQLEKKGIVGHTRPTGSGQGFEWYIVGPKRGL